MRFAGLRRDAPPKWNKIRISIAELELSRWLRDPANPGVPRRRGLYIGTPIPSISISFSHPYPSAKSKGGGGSETEVEVRLERQRDSLVATGAYKRIMLGRAGAEMPACKRNQFAIRYDPGNSLA
ncbi:hypothetical protein EAG_06846 [Camponotus floridanus]|uniref:Uncharacterized protein n=1 Tax=Camponotus floridanus TaxID=104421 RepID=E2A1I9_CAMFO|nr:hypothetical protein EAG_06846 [Camponotus floridanus]